MVHSVPANWREPPLTDTPEAHLPARTGGGAACPPLAEKTHSGLTAGAAYSIMPEKRESAMLCKSIGNRFLL